ncbi:MAG: SMC-Scp complex subunit ScpB, partial [Tabrizicola sp.]
MTPDPTTEESLFDAPPMGEQERMVEAILFASAEPVTLAELVARMPHGADPAEALVRLRKRYEGRGVNLVRVGDSWAFRTAPDLGFLMRRETVETRKLSRAAIETLAIIAYHQPVTRAEIEEIRGVAVSRGTL